MADVKALPGKTDKATDDELAGSEAPLLDHLIELRKRLIRSLIVLFVLLIGCFFFAGPIFDILVEPYRDLPSLFPDRPTSSELIYTAPQEFFFTQLSLALFGAIFLGFPYLAIEIYGFVAPGLYKKERHAFIPYLDRDAGLLHPRRVDGLFRRAAARDALLPRHGDRATSRCWSRSTSISAS